ncbi:hypothetical protein K491DRAFT_583352, partial [Lophiostoma macrostomum CBS 122681]
LFTNPRTCSHLLTRLLNLSNQHSILRHKDDGYIFMRPTMMRLKQGLGGKPISAWTVHNQKSVKFAFQTSFNDLINWRKGATEQGKGAFLKFHCLELAEPVSESRWLHGPKGADGLQPWTVQTQDQMDRSNGNETCLPDAVLKSWRPTFLIRHPALVLPSLLRADLAFTTDLFNPDSRSNTKGYRKAWTEAKAWEVSFHWQRQLFDWYRTNLTQAEKVSGADDVSFPIVLDADDIQAPSAPALLEKYARAVGLDPDVIAFQWDATSGQKLDEMNVYEKRLLDTVSASTGIVPGKTAKGLVLEDEKVKWEKEFGEELGGMLSAWVQEALPDYEHTRQARL